MTDYSEIIWTQMCPVGTETTSGNRGDALCRPHTNDNTEGRCSLEQVGRSTALLLSKDETLSVFRTAAGHG